MPRFGRSEPRCHQNAARATKSPWPAIWLLVGVACAYFGFHAVREELPAGIFRSAFPSMLTPLGMFGVIELLPTVRFRTRRIKWLVLGATTLVAVVWLEAIVPMWTRAATGDWEDAVAMSAGFVLFCAFDWMWGDVGDT